MSMQSKIRKMRNWTLVINSSSTDPWISIKWLMNMSTSGRSTIRSTVLLYLYITRSSHVFPNLRVFQDQIPSDWLKNSWKLRIGNLRNHVVNSSFTSLYFKVKNVMFLTSIIKNSPIHEFKVLQNVSKIKKQIQH